MLHVAQLARLSLSEDELRSMTSQLDTLLAYFDTLSEVDTTGVLPTTHAFAKTNAFREDCVHPSLSCQEALANAPAASDMMFVVPRII